MINLLSSPFEEFMNDSRKLVISHLDYNFFLFASGSWVVSTGGDRSVSYLRLQPFSLGSTSYTLLSAVYRIVLLRSPPSYRVAARNLYRRSTTSDPGAWQTRETGPWDAAAVPGATYQMLSFSPRTLNLWHHPCEISLRHKLSPKNQTL